MSRIKIKIFNAIDDIISDYRFAMRVLDNKPRLYPKDEED